MADDANAPSSSTLTLTVTGVNDAPLVSTSAGTTAFSEGDNVPSTPVAVDDTLTLSDVDNLTLASATVQIGNLQAGDRLAFTSNNPALFGNIAGTFAAGTGLLTLTSAGAIATLDQWRAALRAVTFANTSETPM
jgi:hypothetical protein